MSLHGVGGPGVHQLVQQFVEGPPDVLALACGLLPHDDGDEAVVVRVLHYEANTNWAGGGHHLEISVFFFLRDFIFKKTLFEKLQY